MQPPFRIADETTPTRQWIVILVLAIIFHILFYLIPWKRFFWVSPPAITPIEMAPMDPQTLNQIKNRWEKKLLLGRNQPSSKEAPPDARYFSDRNIKVEREQRASESQVMPDLGQKETQKQLAESKTKNLPPLSKLGISFKKQDQAATEPINPINPMSSTNRDQAVLDDILPQGAMNMLNSAQSTYYAYYSRLYEAIGPVWQSMVSSTVRGAYIAAGDYQTIVDVVFSEDGSYKRLAYVQSSGIPEFDQIVEKAWMRIGVFPNPPKELLDANREVVTRWTFLVNTAASTSYRFNRLE